LYSDKNKEATEMKKYYYEIKPNSNEWWWKPLPKFVTDELTETEIKDICELSDEDLISYHNENIKDILLDNMCLRARMWVTQGECWRRGFEMSGMYVDIISN
jgi:hypothetical protein